MIRIPSPQDIATFGPTGRHWCGTVGDKLIPGLELPFYPEPPVTVTTRDMGQASDVLGVAGKGWSPAQEKAARDAVVGAWAKVFPGKTPTLAELQAVQAIGAHEGSYGLGWKAGTSPVSGKPWGMVGSNNWGATMCKARPTDGVCPNGCGLYTDSRPTKEGQKKFDACFERFATPADGAAGILRMLTHMKGVLRALPSGDLEEIAWQMRLANYFEGFTTDKRAAAHTYALALEAKAKHTAEALGEERAACIGCGAASGGDTEEEASGSSAGLVLGALALCAIAGGVWLGSTSRLHSSHAAHDGRVGARSSRCCSEETGWCSSSPMTPPRSSCLTIAGSYGIRAANSGANATFTYSNANGYRPRTSSLIPRISPKPRITGVRAISGRRTNSPFREANGKKSRRWCESVTVEVEQAIGCTLARKSRPSRNPSRST
jgi:hypothetical protein